MATKPVTYPNIWDSSGIYTTGPFIGSVSIVDPGVGVAGEGHRPGSLFPTAAEHENFQQFQLTTWVRTWLALGSSAGAADAHILETDSVGRFGAVGATFVDAVDETVLDITAANTLAPAVFVTSAATSFQANMANNAGTGFSAPVGTGAGVGFSSTLSGTAAGGTGASISADNTSAGDGIAVDHAGSGTGIKSTATGTGISLDVIGSALALYGARFVGGGFTSLLAEGVGAALGAIIQSSTTAASIALAATLRNNTGAAITVSTPGGSTTAARGILSSVSGLAAAAELISAGYHGAIITGDLTTPTYGALKIEEQDTIPSSFLPNQLARVRPAFGVATHLMESCLEDAGWRGFLTTTGGGAVVLGEFAGPTFHNSYGTYTNLVTFTAVNGNAPKRSGRKIVLRINISARSGSPSTETVLNLRIYDNTAMGYVWTRAGVGTGGGAGYRIVGNSDGGWPQPMTIFVPLTIPAVGNRSWTLEFGNAAGAAVYVRDVVVEALGLN